MDESQVLAGPTKISSLMFLFLILRYKLLCEPCDAETAVAESVESQVRVPTKAGNSTASSNPQYTYWY